jgi:hypothetical protein
LIYFPFEGKRELNKESIKKAEKLNKKLGPYKIKSNYNKNFYIDIKRKCPVPPSKNNNAKEYLRKLFNSPKFIKTINQLYNNGLIFHRVFTQNFEKGEQGIISFGEIPKNIVNDYKNYGRCPVLDKIIDDKK